MTRPTDEQIKALRKGDVVTVRAVVTDADLDHDGDLTIRVNDNGDTYVQPSEIMTIEPREIKVGDRVRDGGHEGEVKAICDGRAWVRFDIVHGGPSAPFLCDARLQELTVIP